ncbi:hypothetical protein ACH42_13595 [Endozoicomonas sp. (ex Bugula neritina AB1)]|nr:hypothetical protein ACH42_13595 [Endozoicomonas sp. (ex Bugula neritina AB1)]
MSRQQKRIEREAKIIETTIQLLEESSFLDLRMSDVSKHAECSMGAVYSHFSCKEDLLLACACFVTQDKRLTLQKVADSNLPPLDKLISIVLLMWAKNNQKPQHYQLQQLAMNPSIWKRASLYRIHAMNDLGQEMQGMVAEIAEQVLLYKRGESVNPDLAGQLLVGLFGLTVGLFQMKESGFGVYNQVITDEEGISLHLDNIERYLDSWGLHYEGLRQRLDELVKWERDSI